MYVHIGSNEVVYIKHIVAMIDKDNSECSEDTQNFLNELRASGKISYTVEDESLIKSYIILFKNNETYAIGTHIRANTLVKRDNVNAIFDGLEIEVLEGEEQIIYINEE